MTSAPPSRNSDNTPQGLDETERTHGAPESPEPSDPGPSRRDEERDQAPDRLLTGSAGGELDDRGEPILVSDNLWWQFGQGAQSLKISALAATVVLAVDLFQPGHMKSWQIFGLVPLYIAGVLLSYSVQRRQHRKRRAHLPVDISAGGRLALICAALVLSTAAGPTTDGLAPRLAFAALILGSTADGAWIALVAAQRRLGFWRALLELTRRDRHAQRHLWTALIGKDEP